MPGCNQSLVGIAKDCGANLGGLKALYMNNFDNVASVTVDDVTKKITAITLAEGADKFKKFNLPKNATSMTHNLNREDANGTNFVTNALALVFNKMDTAKRSAVEALSQNDLCAIVIDMNGKAWYLGKDEPLTAQPSESGTGTAKTDRNGYAVNLQSEEPLYPYEINLGTGEGAVDLDSITD